MNQDINQERIDEICEANNLSEYEVWGMYVDKRIELRPRGAEKAIHDAIEEVGKTLNIQLEESGLLYEFLYEKMLG